MAEWLRDPTMYDVKCYRDVVEAICDYYGERYAEKLIIWLNKCIPDFMGGSEEEVREAAGRK